MRARLSGQLDVEHAADDGLTGVESVLCLLEVVGLRVVVDVVGDLVDTRQGVQDAQVRLRAFEHLVAQAVEVLHLFVLAQVGEALALDAGHVEDVRAVDDLLGELGLFVVVEVVAVAEVLVAVGHLEELRSHEVEARVEEGERLYEGVHRAAVLEVADHGDVDVVEGALGLPDGIEVQEGLRGVLVGTVAGIDDRHVGDLGGVAGGAFQVVAHHDDVGVVADHLDGVLQRLALRGGGAGRITKTNDACTQAIARRFEAEAGAGRGLKEQGGYDFALEKVEVGVLFEEGGIGQK